MWKLCPLPGSKLTSLTGSCLEPVLVGSLSRLDVSKSLSLSGISFAIMNFPGIGFLSAFIRLFHETYELAAHGGPSRFRTSRSSLQRVHSGHTNWRRSLACRRPARRPNAISLRRSEQFATGQRFEGDVRPARRRNVHGRSAESLQHLGPRQPCSEREFARRSQ